MKTFGKLRSNERASATVEFAIIAPVFLLLLFGMLQIGILFLANAGLYNAVGMGARHATLFPTPTADQIRTKINASRFGLDPARVGTPQLVFGKDGTLDYVDVTLTYQVQLDYVFFTPQPFTISRTRRAYLT